MRRALLLTAVIACGPTSSTTDEPASTGTTVPEPTTGADPTTGTTTSGTTSSSSETTAEPTTGAPLEPCTCSLDAECPGSLNDCAAPRPCGKVNEQDEGATDCVLQLLIAQDFAEFDYCNDCGGFETYEGHFVILGPGQGVDLECHIVDFNQDLLVRAHTIEPPAYFEDCLVLDVFTERRNCLLTGFTTGETLPICPASP